MGFSEFFNGISPIFKRRSHIQPIELGFNAFAMVSDSYRKENFHSDIIRDILDPRALHGAHCRFLLRFQDYLVKVAKQKDKIDLAGAIKKLEFDDNIEVLRERGKTDIAIVSENAKWVIIIENKINGAIDMYKQIPGYYNYWREEKKKEVKAILYLTAGEIKFPDTMDWTIKEKEQILPLLLPIVGYSHEEPNLVSDWIEKCTMTTDSFDAKAVLSQYAKLLIKQAGDINMNEIQTCVEAMWVAQVSLNDLKDFVNRYPIWLADRILEGLGGNTKPFTKIEPFTELWKYKEVIVVLDGLILNYDQNTGCKFAIDIDCGNPERLGISLFPRPNDNNEIVKLFNVGKAFPELIEIMTNFGMRYNEGWRWMKSFPQPKSQKDLDDIVNDIIENLLKPLNELSKKH